MEDQSIGSWSWNANAYSARQKTISASSKCEEYDLRFYCCKCIFLYFPIFITGKIFTRHFNSQSERDQHSWYNTIMKEGALSDHYTYRNFTRMTPTLFEQLAIKLAPLIYRQDTKLRRAISVGMNFSTLF